MVPLGERVWRQGVAYTFIGSQQHMLNGIGTAPRAKRNATHHLAGLWCFVAKPFSDALTMK